MTRHNPLAIGGAASGSAVLELPEPRAATPADVSAAPAPSRLKKVSFGTIAKKKDDTKTAYPVFPDDDKGTCAEIAARILERTATFEALKGALETDKADLKFRVSPHYFKVNRGRAEVPSSIAVNSPAGEVLVTFQNRYPLLPDDSGLLPILGDQIDAHFRQDFELKIDGDKLPADHTQELLDRLQALFAEYNCTDALAVKEGIKPVDDFHTARHSRLTVEQNLALEQVCPIVAMVKTKGRK